MLKKEPKTKEKDYVEHKLVNKDKKNIHMKKHKLVALAYVENNNHPVINHIEPNIRNNNKSNLEWGTQKHNIQEASRLGLMIKKPRKGRKIQMICLDHPKLVFIVKDVTEASSFSGISKQMIYEFLQGKVKSCKNKDKQFYIFEYDTTDDL